MSIDKVASSAAELVVGAADRCDVALEELCEGLPLDERTLRSRFARVSWDQFVELIDRLERRMGFTRLELCTQHLPDIGPRSRQMLAAFASERTLVRFVCTLMGPTQYPMLVTTYEEEEQPGGRATGHLTMKLREGFRGSRSFFRLCRSALSAVPCVIGLAPIEVRVEAEDRGARFWLSLPPSQTIFGKWRRRAEPGWNEAIAELEEEKGRLLDAHRQLWARKDSEFGEKLAAAAQRWRLTERQTQVLAGLARGLSNKELAKDLGCSMKTVETHVTEVLRRASQDSRLSLVSTFWRG